MCDFAMLISTENFQNMDIFMDMDIDTDTDIDNFDGHLKKSERVETIRFHK